MTGKRLDGNGDGIAADNYVAILGRGTSLRYTDRDGDLVSLSLVGRGAMEFMQSSNDATTRIQLGERVTDRTLLSGRVTQQLLGDGVAQLDLSSPSSAFVNELPPSFRLTPGAIAAVVDSLLDASELSAAIRLE